ncbi:MAG: hypothetical protein LC130_08875 [Bryobacterales bacterium]|nr:hypothetical protein [Bryobacterales bacterium]
MALFTDGAISTVEDLTAHESGILDLANSECIDLAAKLRIAQDDIGVELTGSWVRLIPYGQNGLSLKNVAVTAPLRLWHTFHSLELTYRDAYGSHLNERYQSKWNQYKALSQWASETLFQVGLGLVWDPLPPAGAPELSYVAGPSGASFYFVRVSWVNRSGEEGLPGELGTLEAPGGTLLAVKAVGAPANARGWYVYAGTAVDDLSRQNSSPMGIGETWFEPATGLVAGALPGAGQEPNCLRGLPRVLERG